MLGGVDLTIHGCGFVQINASDAFAYLLNDTGTMLPVELVSSSRAIL